MTLADRLAAARRTRTEPSAGETPAAGSAAHRLRRSVDPFAEVKRTVHQQLLETLGPKLYDSQMTQGELEQKVRQTLQEVLAVEETPLSNADRTRVASEVADDILGYGPLEPFLRDVEVTEVMVNGFDSIYIEK
ncbi:MAG: CpaF family protein, partial [Actinomycetota bacterium]|nr:CpaF family protein [Actinomycetota bacterium]